MADEVKTAETKEEVKPQPLELNGQPVTVERNGVAWPYKLFKIIKGKDRKGAQYPCPDLTEETRFDDVVTWFGKKNVLNVLQNFAKQVHQRIRFSDQVTDPNTGVFNLQAFLQKAANFDVAGLTLQAISDKIDELQVISTERIMKASAAEYADPKWQEETKRITEEIQNYMAMWDEKKRAGKSAESEATEPSVVA